MITDRTLQDVLTAKQIRNTKVKNFESLTDAEIASLEKGMLTVNTINRIEDKQAELKSLLNDAGYWNIPIINKSWDGDDWFFRDEWQRIINNLNTLRRAYFTYTNSPDTPDIKIHYINLNAVEQILSDMDNIITAMKNQYKKCGTFKCGGGA